MSKSNHIYPDEYSWIYQLMFGSAVLMILITLAIFFVPKKPHVPARKFCLAAWTLLPAMWFAFEYHWLYPAIIERENVPHLWEKFTHGQQVAGQVWAGVVALLIALWFNGAGGDSKSDN